MTPEALLAAAVALIEGSPTSVGLLDTCDVINRTSTGGSSGGMTISETTIASDVPCLYEERIYSNSVLSAQQTQTFVTHDLYLISSAATRAIQPDYKIVVAPRGNIPELTFENPVRLDETLGPLVHLGARLSPV